MPLDTKDLLSSSHISANLTSYEAARSGFFTLIVDNINNIVKASYTGNSADATAADKLNGQAQDTLQLNVIQAPVPHFSLKKESYRRGNDVINFAGVPEFSDGEITVDDVVGMDTKSILMAWQGLAYNVHTRKGGRMADYKKNCTLVEYTQDYAQIRSWTLYGCWISNITEDNFNKEQDGKRSIRATIVYDRAVMNEPTAS
jgi:hypothetical protein